MSAELAKAYDPKEVESKWYSFWLEKNLFRADENSKKKPFCIVIPPPNVTGALHMGHALNNTLQDILVRWRRQQGYETLWQPGTDHAGIATQNVVEREILEKEGKSRHDLGREELVKRIWQWKEAYGDRIIKQLQAIGSSCDWSRIRFTFDEGLSHAVRVCFVDLYKKGLIYRGNYIVNWCPRCQTALADDEVEYGERKGQLWYLRYRMRTENGELKTENRKRRIENRELKTENYLVVATTRPETMLGDTAVAVNPKDKRYKHLVGKTVVLPEVGREIPIIADPFVDPKFGTGCVKVTPAHDPNDFQIGLRHNLPQINVMFPDARMNEQVQNPKYFGLTREECRKQLVKSLQAQGLVEKIEEHVHSVGHCYRCNTVIEPWLSEQWFVKMRSLAKKAIAVTKTNKVKFFPKRWTKFYLSWLENVRDWCISRQIWWGHRIPVWYCSEPRTKNQELRTQCPPIASKETPKKCPKCGNTNLKQDEDVLDTWFSAQLWPFSTLGWPKKTKVLQKFYPNNVLITDRGIIFFWVARMVMMGLEQMKKEPFRHVYIHGTILDKFGAKMSKSKPETCIDPLDIIERYGADALRYSLALMATEGQDLKLEESKFEAGKHFCNKLWNATRFALMNLQTYDGKPDQEKNLVLADRWIWNRLQKAIQKINGDLENYRYADSAQALYHFIWNEFCDWYLELIKPTVMTSHATQWNLHRVLDAILRIAHPFMPFITEELWQNLNDRTIVPSYHRTTSLVVAEYPKTVKKIPFSKETKEMELVQQVITAIRNIRGEHNVNPKNQINVFLKTSSKKEWDALQKNQSYISKLASVSALQFMAMEEKVENAAVSVAGRIEIFVPFEQLFDVEEEKGRLEKEIAKTKEDVERLELKLANKNFVERAPKEVVEKEKLRLAEFKEKLGKLNEALWNLKNSSPRF